MSHNLNPKTLAAGAVLVIAVAVAVPGAVAYLPFLLLLACPLAMMWMMGGMGGGHMSHGTSNVSQSQIGEYSCPVHDEIRSTFPGHCPICGMELKARTGATHQG